MEKRLIRKRPKDFSLTKDCVLLYMGGVRDKHDDECHPRLAEEDRAKAFWSAILQKAEDIKAEIGPQEK